MKFVKLIYNLYKNKHLDINKVVFLLKLEIIQMLVHNSFASLLALQSKLIP